MPETHADLIGSREAAELLQVDRSTFTRWVALGRIAPAYRLPGATGALLFRAADVTALLRASEEAS